jgi:hypothetical protein
MVVFFVQMASAEVTTGAPYQPATINTTKIFHFSFLSKTLYKARYCPMVGRRARKMSRRYLMQLEDDQEGWGVFIHHRNRPRRVGLRKMRQPKPDDLIGQGVQKKRK